VRALAIEPGRYTLSPHPLTVAGGSPAVVVLEGEVEVRIDLRLAASEPR
jgi:hypothetical protein